MDKVLFIVNPSSGGRQGLEIAGRLEETLANSGLNIQNYETTGEEDFKQLTVEAIRNGIKRVFIFGGDGTISEYVRAISGLKERPDIVLIPSGTTNNFAQALNTELNMDSLISKLEADNLVEKQVDVGQINEDYFISTLSAGSIPEMAWKTDDDLKEDLGPFAYILEGISALNENEAFDITLETDKDKVLMENITLLVIGLSNSVFGVSTFFEDAKINDGMFHFYALKNSDLLKNTVSLTSDVFMRSTKENENELSYITSFNKGKIEASENMNLAMDGEKGPAFPIDLYILQEHLTFLVPETEN